MSRLLIKRMAQYDSLGNTNLWRRERVAQQVNTCKALRHNPRTGIYHHLSETLQVVTRMIRRRECIWA